MIGAEAAYLFRHALLRDAAYDLHIPSDRARLHLLAAQLIESAQGGRPPDPAPLERMQPNNQPHSTDPFAFEIAQHLQRARGESSSDDQVQAALRMYLQRAAEYSTVEYQYDSALEAWRALELLSSGVRRECCRYQIAYALWQKGDLAGANAIGQMVAAAMSGFGQPRLQALALRFVGASSIRTAPAREVCATLNEALALFSQTDDHHGRMVALQTLADAYEQTDERVQALETLQAIIDYSQRVGNTGAEAHARVSLSVWQRRAGDTIAAIESLRYAIRQFQRTGERSKEAGAWSSLCVTLAETGEALEAQEALKSARSVALACGHRRQEAQLLTIESRILRQQGRAKDAAEVLIRAVSALRECGDRIGEASALSALGVCYFDMKAYAQAKEALLASLRVNESLGLQSGVASCAGNLAIIEHRLGRLSASAGLFERCLAYYMKTPDVRFQGYFQASRGLLRLEMRDLDGAHSDWKHGLQLLKGAKAEPLIAQLRTAMSDICKQHGVSPLSESPE